MAHDRGKTLLQWDAVYCAVAGATALALASPLASLFTVPEAVLAALGAASLAWACILAVLAARRVVAQLVATVAAANLVATGALLALAALAPGLAAKTLVLAVAVEVAAFATLQLRAVARTR